MLGGVVETAEVTAMALTVRRANAGARTAATAPWRSA
jgi:hypothetical protein